MKININFNGFTCWYNELAGFFQEINWQNFKENDIVYYASASEFAIYNFRIFYITDDKVELIAIPE